MKVKSIEEEIQQSAFESAAQKVAINLMFTSKAMEEEMNGFMKPFGLTAPQFNVLRILRGQKGKPASVKLIMGRMLDKSSNVSRLLDKLVKKQWVERRECQEDRRQVDVVISKSGLDLLSRIDGEIGQYVKTGKGMSEKEMNQLSDLLDRWRAAQ